MAPSPARTLSDLHFGPQSKTLFLTPPGTSGLLLSFRRGRPAFRRRRFSGSAAALAFCEHSKTNLIYWFAPSLELS